MALFKKLLVIDDDPAALMLVDFAARPLDMAVTKAADVNEAIAKARAETFDVVVIDHDVNGVRGWEMLDYLRKPLGNVPVLVFSGRVSDQDRQEYQRRGVAAVLDKPLSRDAIGFAIRRALKL